MALIGAGLPLLTSRRRAHRPRAKRPALPPIAAPPANKLLAAMIRLQDATRRDLVIAGGAKRGTGGAPVYDGDPKRIWTINGASGEASAKPLFSVKRGTPVSSRSGTTRRRSSRCTSTATPSACCTPWTTAGSPIASTPCRCRRTGRSASPSIADNPGKWLSPRRCSSASTPGLWTWFEVT